MNCDRVQAAISERMDGERLPGRVAAAVESHLTGCAACRDFSASAGGLRTAVRIRPAEQIPDLVEPIMAAIAAEGAGGQARARRRGGPPRRPASIAPVAAALVVGIVAGSVAVGGPWQSRERQPMASADDVIRGVRVAARRVEAHHATFTIAERGLSPAVPTRSLEAELWFAAPGRYRLEVHDRTTYPSGAWTPTDLLYVEDGSAEVRSGPAGCLAAAECPPTRGVFHERTRYATSAPLAADLVVPLDVLASPRGLTVERTGMVMGRPAVLVSTSFARAAPMFPFLGLGGTWRPFFAEDRVELWVDAEDWSPLRWTVYPADLPERADWELRFGLLPERPNVAILDVAATAIDRAPPDASLFAVAGAEPPVPLTELPEHVGFRPVTPTATEDLTLTAVAAPSRRGAGGSLLTYSRGLTYLHVGERRRWDVGASAPVDADTQQVRVGGGVAYYEPAGEGLGRRLAIHTRLTTISLETNLSREELLAVAASLPVAGREIPAARRVDSIGGSGLQRLTLSQAKARTSFAFDLPGDLPGGYLVASVEHTMIRGAESVTLYLRQPDSDLGAGPIRIHLEPAARLPAASSADTVGVTLDGLEARWTPSQSRLEWVADGIYRSVDGAGLGREIIGALAARIRASR